MTAGAHDPVRSLHALGEVPAVKRGCRHSDSDAAIIPPRRNASHSTPSNADAVARNEVLKASSRVGRTVRRGWSGYRRDNRARTKMHWMKLPGHAAWRVTSTGRSRRSTSATPAWTATPLLASQSHWPKDASVQGKRNLGQHKLWAREPLCAGHRFTGQRWAFRTRIAHRRNRTARCGLQCFHRCGCASTQD